LIRRCLASAAVEYSGADPPQLPANTDAYVPDFEDSRTYLSTQHAGLATAAITPIEVHVQPSIDARAFGSWEDRSYRMFIGRARASRSF
jgi:hypothetical protein